MITGVLVRNVVLLCTLLLLSGYAENPASVDTDSLISSDSLSAIVVDDSILWVNDASQNVQKNNILVDTSISQLQKMVVTSGRRQRLFESNRSVLIIGPEEWLGTNKSVADVIAEHTGIQTRKYGGMGSFQTISIRGVKGSEILVLLDGVPLNSAMGGAVDLGIINPIHLQEIEVYKGVVSSIMGGNSLGGVINLKTKPVTKGTSFDLQTEIGSFGKQRIASGIYQTINPEVTLYGAASFGHCENNFPYLDRNNTIFGPPDWGTNDPRNDDTIRTLENGQYRSFDLTVHPLVVLPKYKKRIAGNVYYSDIIRHIPAQESKENETARYLEKKVVASVSFQNEDSTRFQITPRIGYVFTDGVTKWSGEDQGFGSSHGGKVTSASSGMAEHTLDGKLEMHYSLFDNMRLQGLLYCQAGDARPRYNRGGDAHGNWHSRRALGGAALDGTADAGRFTFTTGGSFSGVYDETEGGIDGVSSYQVEPSDTITLLWNAEAGIAFALFDNTKICVNGGHYSNQPSLRERFGARGAVMANPELEAEHVNSAEACMKLYLRWLYVECAAFYSRCTNTIEFSSDGYLVKPVNIDGSRNYGLELSSTVDITKYVSVDLSSTWQKTKNLDKKYIRKNRMMPDEPELSIVSTLNVNPFTGLRLSYTFQFKSFYFHDLANTDLFRVPAVVNSNTKEYGSFSHDLQLVWKMNKNFDIRCSIDDINFGKQYSMANSIECGYGTIVTPATWWNFAVGYSF